MGDLNDFLQRHHVEKKDLFDLVLGQTSDLLPGNVFGGMAGYRTIVGEDELIIYNAKDDKDVHIPYADFQSAEFGIGSANLWLQCIVRGSSFIFCSPRKSWKSELGKKLIEKINAVTPIQSMSEYDKFTGKLFFIYMFK